MKILHVISSVFRAGGGTSEVVPRLCRALQDAGHEVTLAVVEFGDVSVTAEEAVRAGVRLLRFPLSAGLRALAPSRALRRALPKLVAEADVVHLHGLWQAPCWHAAAECLRQHKPYVMMPHGFLEPERMKISKWKKRLIGLFFDRRYLSHASALVATASREVNGFRAYGLKNPTHVMPIGLDMENFKLADFHNGFEKPKKRLLYFSRITPIKGLDMLVEAWAKLKEFHNDWELVIAGPDDRGYAQELKTYIMSLGLTYAESSTATPSSSSTILFTGPVYGEAKFAMLRSADVFVLPTRNENWSIAVAEALATGLPIVCTRGAPWQCIEECGAGYWVDITAEGIWHGLRELLSATIDRRREMGVRGRQWVLSNLEWKRIAEKMTDCYRAVQRNEDERR